MTTAIAKNFPYFFKNYVASISVALRGKTEFELNLSVFGFSPKLVKQVRGVIFSANTESDASG